MTGELEKYHPFGWDIYNYINNNNSNNSVDDDDDDDGGTLEDTQVEAEWPVGHPLPLPQWSYKAKAVLEVETIWEYEEIASSIEFCVQKLLEEHNYNSVGNFLAFYERFKASGVSRRGLNEYFQM